MSQYIKDYVEQHTFDICVDIKKYLSCYPDRRVQTIAMCGDIPTLVKAIVVYEDKVNK